MALERLGLVKTTLLDYPGLVAATVFTPGCNLRCPYCHNPEFVSGAPTGEEIPPRELFQFLEKRKGVLGGVCITGGEPLIHKDLASLIDPIRRMGLKVKLDTNGTFPERLAAVEVDYIAMDLKTRLSRYPELAPPQPGNSTLGKRVRESLEWIKQSGIPHHFRTTAVPGFVEEKDWEEIMSLLEGEEVFYLTGFRPLHTLDKAYQSLKPHPRKVLEEWKARLEARGVECILRVSEGSPESYQTEP